MTLREAFEKWSNDGHERLAMKYRTAVKDVLMAKWADTEIGQVDTELARRIFAESDRSQELKTKAGSALLHVLQWGADKGHCKKPQFSYTIANSKPSRSRGDRHLGKPQEPVPATATGKPQEPVPVAAASPEKKFRTCRRDDRPMAQIDPVTLEVVKVWPALKTAQQELGVKNVGRSADRLSKAGGFYWSDAGDADTFRERLEKKLAEMISPTDRLAAARKARQAMCAERRASHGDRHLGKTQEPVPGTAKPGKAATDTPASVIVSDPVIEETAGMLRDRVERAHAEVLRAVSDLVKAVAEEREYYMSHSMLSTGIKS